jgi:ribonuclease J
MLSLVKPKFFIPVHGEYRQLIAHRNTARQMGIDAENILLMKNGKVLELNEKEAKFTNSVPTGKVMVDGLGVGDVGNIVLRDRQNLAENGIIIVVMTFEKYSNQLLAGPDMVSRGFVYVREAENLLEEARATVNDAVIDCIDRNITDWGKIKMVVKETLSDYLWKKIKRNPMILPIIMEVE